jgi:hypothetical protein
MEIEQPVVSVGGCNHGWDGRVYAAEGGTAAGCQA